MKRTRALTLPALFAGIVLVLAGCGPAPGSAGGSSAGGPTLTIGLTSFPGNTPFFIADSEGFFKQEGINVQITMIEGATAMRAAVQSGRVDAMVTGASTWLGNLNGLDVKAVEVTDQSTTADAILGGAGINSLKDLAGKSVAVEQGSTSDVFLHAALQQAGVPFSSIKAVNLPTGQAGSALIAGKVDAAVTYEPYITAAKNAGHDIKSIYTAGELPGVVSSVFQVRSDIVAKDPGLIVAAIRARDKGLAYLEANATQGRQILADRIGADPNSLAASFDGVKLFRAADSAALVAGVFPTTIDKIRTAMQTAGIQTSANFNFGSAYDKSFAQQAAGGN